MPIEWIVFEIFINFVEVGTIFYLLCHKFSAKYQTIIPTLIFTAINTVYLSLPLFINMYLPPVEMVTLLIYFLYIWLFRNGSVLKKIIWVALSYAIMIGIAFLVPALLTLLGRSSVVNILTEPSGIRLIMMIAVRMINVIVFYVLSLNKKKDELLYSSSILICFIVPIISISSEIIIYYLLLKDTSHNIPNNLIYIMSISYLIINIMVFIMYEKINNEAEKNYLLETKNKQYEITEQHNKQIVKIYSDIRKWRHDYANHMQIVMTLIEKTEVKDININEAVTYIKDLDEKITSSSSRVSTGNYIIDAIISAKLSLAISFDIDFKYNISLISKLSVSDTDLCALLSNLLDNAIEACRKLDNNRYINIELFLVKNQLHIKILNSADGKYKIEGGKLKTTKKSAFHGIGTKHIEDIVEKYGGIYEINAEEKSFTSQISIPLINKTEV